MTQRALGVLCFFFLFFFDCCSFAALITLRYADVSMRASTSPSPLFFQLNTPLLGHDEHSFN